MEKESRPHNDKLLRGTRDVANLLTALDLGKHTTSNNWGKGGNDVS